MPNAHESVKKKVAAILTKLSGSRAKSLDGATYADTVRKSLAQVLTGSYPPAVANEMAFHLVDWNSDAAFLVAFLLFPQRFTQEEIEAGVILLLVHVPAHVIAAARLGDIPTVDTFAKTEPVQRSRVATKQSRRATQTKRRLPPAPRCPRRT
jgi:hypothetical protein